MKYRIDQNTPIPSMHTSKKYSLFDTMADMPPDRTASFLIPLQDRKEGGVRAEVYATAKKIRARYPERVYATRFIPKEKGVRVWRTK